MNDVLPKISNFKIVLPLFSRQQEDLLQWTQELRDQAAELLGSEIDKEAVTESDRLNKKLSSRYSVKPDQINRRYFECADIMNPPHLSQEVYNLKADSPNGADIGFRNQFYAQRAEKIFEKIYTAEVDSSSQPDHLIHVTCTGYVSPSAAQKVVADKKWTKKTAVTHAYHMGCYASLPAIRMAQSFVIASPEKIVDVVHTEMCGLHMIPSLQSPEQWVVQSLFADGHIKYSVQSGQNEERGFIVHGIEEHVIRDTEDFMTWQPTANGMAMTLSREVPLKIKESIDEFLNQFLQSLGRDKSLLQDCLFAIHPGGPRIIEVIKEALDLSEDQISHSRQVLFERGNMSSATLPHVWAEILKASPAPGTFVVSLAFGPGLTVFGALFEVD